MTELIVMGGLPEKARFFCESLPAQAIVDAFPQLELLGRTLIIIVIPAWKLQKLCKAGGPLHCKG